LAVTKIRHYPNCSIDAGSALTTACDVKLALVGAYKDFGTADFFGGIIFLEGDLDGLWKELTGPVTYQE